MFIFFKTRKDFERFKTAFSIYLLISCLVLLDGMFTTTVYSSKRGPFVNSAFPKKNMKIFAQNSKLYFFMFNENESKRLRKFYVSSKQNKEYYKD